MFFGVIEIQYRQTKRFVFTTIINLHPCNMSNINNNNKKNKNDNIAWNRKKRKRKMNKKNNILPGTNTTTTNTTFVFFLLLATVTVRFCVCVFNQTCVRHCFCFVINCKAYVWLLLLLCITEKKTKWNQFYIYSSAALYFNKMFWNVMEFSLKL